MAAIAGTNIDDILMGSAQWDNLDGGGGTDHFTGGLGGDLFVIEAGDSDATAALGAPTVLDTITDWTPEDRLLFVGAAPMASGALYQDVAADYDAAYLLAMDAYALSGAEFAAIQVGADVFVFAMRTGQAVKLATANVVDVLDASFTTGSLSSGLVETGSIADDDRSLSIGGDYYVGVDGNDTVSGDAGVDTLSGGLGDDRISGGDDDDIVDGGAGLNHLQGDGGDDFVAGGAEFDVMNGNVGNDLLMAGDGDDWARGGKGDDIVSGEAGADFVAGDLGNDTADGGLGDDVVMGGAGEDRVVGGEGADTLSGDAGFDGLEGGLGADTFLANLGMQYDWVMDFNQADGDVVQVEAGVTYTTYQAGSDTVVELSDGGHLVLVGVDMTTLTDGWIVGG